MDISHQHLWSCFTICNNFDLIFVAKMNTFVIFAVAFAILGSCLADVDHPDKEVKRERVVAFYKCLSCGPKEAMTAYEKCEQFKPEKGKTHLEECLKKVLPEEAQAEDETWKYFCQNPATIEKTYDCLSDEEFIKSLSEEDLEAMKKFKACAKGVKEQYCKV